MNEVRAFLLACLLLPQAAHSQWIREGYEGLRPLGMGNAFVAVANDKNALWYNPAGLALLKGYNYDLYDIVVGADNMDSFNRVTKGLSSADHSGLLRADKQFERFGFYPAFYSRYVTLAPYFHLSSFTEFRDFQADEVDVYSVADTGIIAGVSVALATNTLIGVTARAVQRTGVDLTMGTSAFLEMVGKDAATAQSAPYDTIKPLLGKGLGYGVSAGILFIFPLRNSRNDSRWQLGVVVDDIGGVSFKQQGESPRAPSIKSSTNFGVAFIHPFSSKTTFSFALDYRHLWDSLSVTKGLHLGFELKVLGFALRIGANQGQVTGGIGYESQFVRVNMVTTATELGSRLYERSQRWYLVQVALGMNVSDKARPRAREK